MFDGSKHEECGAERAMVQRPHGPGRLFPLSLKCLPSLYHGPFFFCLTVPLHKATCGKLSRHPENAGCQFGRNLLSRWRLPSLTKLYQKIGLFKIAIMKYTEAAIICPEETAYAKGNTTYPFAQHPIGCERQPAPAPPTL